MSASRVRTVLAVCSGLTLVAVGAQSLHAQCADGTPPPCEVRAEQVVARATPPPSAAERGRSFLVLPFRNVRGIADDDWLTEAPVMLGDALSRWQEVSVVSHEELYSALRRHRLTEGEVMDEAKVRRVAEETGGWTVVTGEVLRLGTRIRVGARARDVATNRIIARITEQAASDEEIPEVYEKIAAELLKTTGLDVPTSQLAAAPTQSLGAYKAYLRGLARYNRGESVGAREAFLEAVSLDSTFAQAYAKLAMVSLTPEDLLNPQSERYRYAARAAALAQRLPPRERALVRAVNDLWLGQVSAARESLEELVAADSNDVEALENLSVLEMSDFLMVGVDGEQRPRGSFNNAARLAKRVLALDPNRHQNYQMLYQVYAFAGGLFGGLVPGLSTEGRTLLMMLQTPPERLFVALLRDSIELVPADSLRYLGPGSLRAYRKRARDVVLQWVTRWLNAAPQNSQAHWTASFAYELDEQFEEALEELNTADSLGVELPVDARWGRRMLLLAKQRKFEEAMVIADSLTEAGYFDTLEVFAQAQAAPPAFNLYLLSGRLEDADAVAGRLSLAFRALGVDSATARQAAATSLTNPVTDVAGMAHGTQTFRFEALDSLFARIKEIPPNGILEEHLGVIVGAAGGSGPAMWEFQAHVAAGGRAAMLLLADTERSNLLVGLAGALVNLDSAETARLEVLEILAAVVVRQPDNLGAHYQIGKIGALTGKRLDMAEASLRVYLQHDEPAGGPSHAGAHWRLGMIFEHRGETELARAEYETALKLSPNLRQAREALEKLGTPEP